MTVGDAPVRLAVVGVGGMGACHAHNATELAGAEVAWVADPDEAAGRSLADEIGARWTADGHEALADCDAAVIACPDRFHARYVMDALDRGLPTLCEKPLTVELADARAIVEREVEIGRRLVQVGFMRVYDERHIQLRDALDGLGPLLHIRCVHRNANRAHRPAPQILVESVIHDIHTVRWLAGAEIAEVLTTAVTGDGDGARLVLVTCRLANGAVATLEFDESAAGYEVSVEATATHGNVVTAEPLRATVRSAGRIGAAIGDDWFAPFLPTYRTEMRVWLDAIAAGTTVGPSTWDGYAAQVVVEAAATSFRTGRPEPVDLPARPSLFEVTAS